MEEGRGPRAAAVGKACWRRAAALRAPPPPQQRREERGMVGPGSWFCIENRRKSKVNRKAEGFFPRNPCGHVVWERKTVEARSWWGRYLCEPRKRPQCENHLAWLRWCSLFW